jgi:hypothetical protein
MRSHVQGTIYLLHFTQPYRHARHYMGKPASSGLPRGRWPRTCCWGGPGHGRRAGSRLFQIRACVAASRRKR